MRGPDGEELGRLPSEMETMRGQKKEQTHLPDLPVEITLSVRRVEVGAGVEIHDDVEPRRHKCLPGRESGEMKENLHFGNFWEISRESWEEIQLTISVEPSLAALRNLFCLSWMGRSR